MNGKILSIVNKLEPTYTVEDSLKQSLLDINTDPSSIAARSNGAVTIFVRKENNEFEVGYISGTLSYSEILAALVIFQDFLLREMNT